MLGIDPLVNYNFFVEIDGITIGQFRECEGLSINVKVIEHRAMTLGGKTKLRKLPGQISYDDIVLKRGKINDDSFWKWIGQVQSGDIDGARKTGHIVIYDFAGGKGSAFEFKFGWPTEVEIGKLQAFGNEVLVETCKITHEGLTHTPATNPGS
jgi:phage tail-like protein